MNIDYHTNGPQFVKGCVSGEPHRNTTVLFELLLTLYTSDSQYNSESCHPQKYPDDSAVVKELINGFV